MFSILRLDDMLDQFQQLGCSPSLILKAVTSTLEFVSRGRNEKQPLKLVGVYMNCWLCNLVCQTPQVLSCV